MCHYSIDYPICSHFCASICHFSIKEHYKINNCGLHALNSHVHQQHVNRLELNLSTNQCALWAHFACACNFIFLDSFTGSSVHRPPKKLIATTYDFIL